MRDFKKSRFKKIIGINEEHYDFVVSIKYKKSIAGKLEEIINYYKENYEDNRN